MLKEHPALAGLGRLDAALPRVEPEDGGGHAQELRGLVKVQRAHGSALIAVHPHVVPVRLCPGLASDVVPQAFGELPGRVVVVGLQGV